MWTIPNLLFVRPQGTWPRKRLTLSCLDPKAIDSSSGLGFSDENILANYSIVNEYSEADSFNKKVLGLQRQVIKARLHDNQNKTHNLLMLPSHVCAMQELFCTKNRPLKIHMSIC